MYPIAIPTGLLLLALTLPAVSGFAREPGPAGGNPPPPQLEFESVFDAYRPYRHQAAAPWREANDRVGAIGGWRTYAREAAEQEDPSPPDSPAPSGSGGMRDPNGHGHGGVP